MDECLLSFKVLICLFMKNMSFGFISFLIYVMLI